MITKSNLIAWLGTSIREADFEEFHRVGDGPITENLTSATFEKVWRNRGRYRRDLAAAGDAKLVGSTLGFERNISIDIKCGKVQS